MPKSSPPKAETRQPRRQKIKQKVRLNNACR
jgi:hypothetical protein